MGAAGAPDRRTGALGRRPYHRCVLRPSSLPHALAGSAAGLAARWLRGVRRRSPQGRPSRPRRPRGRSRPAAPTGRSRWCHGSGRSPPTTSPTKGPIIIRGTVTNTSEQTWTAINVHGFMGATPITTSAELAAAAQVPVDADVGHRITVPGTFASISHLAPGATASFRVRLPHSTPAGVCAGRVLVRRPRAGRQRRRRRRASPSAATAPSCPTSLTRPCPPGPRRTPLSSSRSGPASSGAPTARSIDPESWATDLRSGALHDVAPDGAGGTGPTADVAGRPGRARRRTPARAGQPGSHPGRLHAWQPGEARRPARRRARRRPARPRRRPAEPAAAGRRRPPSDSRGAGSPSSARCSPPTPARCSACPTAISRSSRPSPTTLPCCARRSGSRTGRTASHGALAAGSIVAPPDGRTTGDTHRGPPSQHRRAAGRHRRRPRRPHRQPGQRPPGRPGLDRRPRRGGPAPSTRAARWPCASASCPRRPCGSSTAGSRSSSSCPAKLEAHVRDSFFSGSRRPVAPAHDVRRRHRRHPRRPSTPAGCGPRLPTSRGSARGCLRPAATPSSTPAAPCSRCSPTTTSCASACSRRSPATRRTPPQQDPLLALSRMRLTAQWVRGNLAHIGLAAPPSVTLASTSGRFSVLVSNDLDVPVTVQGAGAVGPPPARSPAARRSRSRRTAGPASCSTPRPTSAACTR